MVLVRLVRVSKGSWQPEICMDGFSAHEKHIQFMMRCWDAERESLMFSPGVPNSGRVFPPARSPLQAHAQLLRPCGILSLWPLYWRLWARYEGTAQHLPRQVENSNPLWIKLIPRSPLSNPRDLQLVVSAGRRSLGHNPPVPFVFLATSQQSHG